MFIVVFLLRVIIFAALIKTECRHLRRPKSESARKEESWNKSCPVGVYQQFQACEATMEHGISPVPLEFTNNFRHAKQHRSKFTVGMNVQLYKGPKTYLCVNRGYGPRSKRRCINDTNLWITKNIFVCKSRLWASL